MDKFTENLAEGLRRFAMAGVGAVSLTIEKSKEIIDTLIAKGEATTGDGQAALDELQQKMASQFDAFSKRLRKDYEEASFESLLERVESLTEEQRAQLIEHINALQAEKTAREAAQTQQEAEAQPNAKEEENAAPCDAATSQPDAQPCECEQEVPQPDEQPCECVEDPATTGDTSKES